MQKVTYTYTGETQTFYFDFPYFEKNNIVVKVDNQSAPAYNVIGVKGGADPDFPYISGRIVFVKPLKKFQTITIERHLPLVRQVDFQPTTQISTNMLNQDMNYTLELLKDIKDEFDTFHDKYADIVDKESTNLLLEKIALVNQNIANMSTQAADIPDIQEDIETIKNTLTDLADDILELQNSGNNQNNDILDYIVETQTPTASNNYTWYRKYKSGWVEMGGLVSDSSGEGSTSLPITMLDTNYHISAINEPTSDENAWGWVFIKRNSKTTTGFTLSSIYGSGQEVALRARWQVSGLCA